MGFNTSKKKKRDQNKKCSKIISLLPTFILKTHLNPFLFPDFPANVCSGVESDWSAEVRQTTEYAAVPYSLRILTEDIARDEVCEDACTKHTVTNMVSLDLNCSTPPPCFAEIVTHFLKFS